MIVYPAPASHTSGSDLLLSGSEALGIRLTREQSAQFCRFYQEMLDWNSRVNLTAITQWEHVQTRHFLDSLSTTRAIPAELLKSARFVDIGSGAGFPGIPLKIAFPGLKATLVDSTAKKTAFLVHVKEVLEMQDVEVCTGRAETLAHEPAFREQFHLVFSRAVAEMATLAELTLPFCRLGGLVIAQKKLDIQDELAKAEKAIDTLGGRLKEIKRAAVEGLDDTRGLVVLEKIKPTPERYPRRSGMPAKRPL